MSSESQTITAIPENTQLISLKSQVRPLCSSLFDSDKEELVDIALHRLQNACIQLVEWGALLSRRMHVPIIIRDFTYLVPDDDLDTASTILSDMGLPLTPPSDLLLKNNGDLYVKSRLHRITHSTSLSSVRCLMLCPLSFPSFTISELASAPRPTSLASPLCQTIQHPIQPAVYASILRTMLAYPRYCPTRYTLESNLSELIGYDLYDFQIGYADIDDEELCEALEADRRVNDAMCRVKGWGWDGAWREEEEWMGDALASVVKGWGEIECLPWAPPQTSSR